MESPSQKFNQKDKLMIFEFIVKAIYVRQLVNIINVIASLKFERCIPRSVENIRRWIILLVYNVPIKYYFSYLTKNVTLDRIPG